VVKGGKGVRRDYVNRLRGLTRCEKGTSFRKVLRSGGQPAGQKGGRHQHDGRTTKVSAGVQTGGNRGGNTEKRGEDRTVKGNQRELGNCAKKRSRATKYYIKRYRWCARAQKLSTGGGAWKKPRTVGKGLLSGRPFREVGVAGKNWNVRPKQTGTTSACDKEGPGGGGGGEAARKKKSPVVSTTAPRQILKKHPHRKSCSTRLKGAGKLKRTVKELH